MSSNKHFARAACAAGLALALGIMPLAGCSTAATSASTQASTASVQTASAGEAVTLVNIDDMVSDRDQDPSYDEASSTKIALADSGATVDGDGVTCDSSTVTITKAGTYVISGTLEAGQIVIDAEDAKVQLVLNGTSVTCADSAALYVKNAKKVFLTLAAGTANTLSTSGEFVQTDDSTVDGAIFAKDDLTINGEGSLSVTSAAGHGIVCKDDLVLVGGQVSVNAAKHAVQGKDLVAIVGGTWTLVAGTDGIHCENSDDAEKGYVCVAGGTVDITAESDGFDAANVLEVDGGTITVAAADDGLHAELDLAINGGTVTVTKSYEGIEGQTVTITGGTIDVVSSDDGINAAGAPSDSSGGETTGEQGTAPSGDANGGPGANGDTGTEPPTKPEGDATTSTDGTTTTTDGTPSQTLPSMPSGEAPAGDGQAPSGDGQAPTTTDGQQPDMTQQPGGDMGGDMGGGGDEYDSTAQVTITGGSITIQAGGDGIDSNGDFTVSGGVTCVSGPTGGGNGMLDFAGTGTITGGQVFCAGTTDMLQIFGDTSSQGCIAVTLSGNAGDTVTLSDESGNTLASFSPTTSYQCVVFSVDGIESGETYTVSNGTSDVTFTTESLIYNGVTSSGGMGQGGPGQGGEQGGQGGGPGGQNGQAPSGAPGNQNGSSQDAQNTQTSLTGTSTTTAA